MHVPEWAQFYSAFNSTAVNGKTHYAVAKIMIENPPEQEMYFHSYK